MTGQDMERNQVRYKLTCYSASGSGATSDVCGTTIGARRGWEGPAGTWKESEPAWDTCALEGAGQNRTGCGN